MKFLFVRFFSISAFFCNFTAKAMSTFFFVSSSFFDWLNLKHLWLIFLICSFWVFWSCHNCNSRFCKIVIETIFLMLLMNELNSFARIESFHCMFHWIFDFYLFVKACFIFANIYEWVLQSDYDENFKLSNDIICSKLLKMNFLNCLIYTSTLINHIFEFLKTLWIVFDLKALLRILLKILQKLRNCVFHK